eukprot:8465631-Alexandrium_andersonii.AAC.1
MIRPPVATRTGTGAGVGPARGPADVGLSASRLPAADRIRPVHVLQKVHVPRAQAAARVRPRRATSAAEARAV